MEEVKITYDNIKSDKKKQSSTLDTSYFLKHVLRVKAWIFLK